MENKIRVIDNFISDNDIEIAMKLFASKKLVQFRTIPHVKILEADDEINTFIAKYSRKVIQAYRDAYGITAPLFPCEGNLTVWDEGYGTGVHIDHHTGYEFVQLSSVTYLNDDYEGGEIYFPELDFENKPKRGQTIIFPAFTKEGPYLHGVKEISKAKRYTLAIWHTSFEKYAALGLV